MAKKKAKKKTLDLTLPIYQLKISLEQIDPPIWRRVQMDDCSLAELHEIIQIVMGWEGMHPHVFVIDGEDYGRGGDCEYDSRFVSLSEVVEQGHTRFRYDYDFGDDWEHSIEIEKTLPAEEGVRYPRCVKGERACPPEDSGGPYGYALVGEMTRFCPHNPLLRTGFTPEQEAMAREAYGKIGHFFDPTYEQFERQALEEPRVNYQLRVRQGRCAACRASPSRPAATAALGRIRGRRARS